MTSEVSKPRQIVAIVLSQILNELAQGQMEVERLTQEVKQSGDSVRSAEGRAAFSNGRPKAEPRAVVWLAEEMTQERELDAKRGIDAVNRAAREYGVCVGQTIAEARALVAQLAISVVKTQRLRAALERVAESMARFGTTVAVTLPDTVCVEVTGVTQLFGGDTALLEEMRSVLDELGHQARLAMTDGPQLARAFAVWETRRQGKAAVVISAEHKHACLRALPISGLPLPDEVKINLAKLGLLSAGDLLDREPAVVTSRLGDHAHAITTLLRGEDTTPLVAHRPLALPEEALDWDEPLAGNEPVLFALRRLTTQVASRLRGRALAAQSLELTLKHDPAIARFRGKEAFTRQVVQLAAPLGRAEDLWRVLTARIAKIQVDVPNIGVMLKVLSVEETKQRQLDLAVGFSKLDAADPERMAVLFSELATDIGAENFGTLRLANTHKPEKMTLLAPVGGTASESGRSRRRRVAASRTLDTGGDSQSFQGAPPSEQMGLGEFKTRDRTTVEAELPARLLPSAIPVQTRFRAGEWCPLGTKLYTIMKVTFLRRLEAVEWWSNEPCSRDYVQLWLSSPQGELQVLAYVDRVTQTRYVQGWYD
jgi:protein ImuB